MALTATRCAVCRSFQKCRRYKFGVTAFFVFPAVSFDALCAAPEHTSPMQSGRCCGTSAASPRQSCVIMFETVCMQPIGHLSVLQGFHVSMHHRCNGYDLLYNIDVNFAVDGTSIKVISVCQVIAHCSGLMMIFKQLSLFYKVHFLHIRSCWSNGRITQRNACHFTTSDREACCTCW
jgi:hypothetical protein